MPRARQESGGIDLRKNPDIVFRPMGRENVYGLSDHPMFREVSPLDHPMIEIDTHTKGRNRLMAVIHETMHLALPALPESLVKFASIYIARVVWKLGYRADEEAQDSKYAPSQE